MRAKRIAEVSKRVYTFDQMAVILRYRGGDFADKLMAVVAYEQLSRAEALEMVAPVAAYLIAQYGEGGRERFIALVDGLMADFERFLAEGRDV